MRELLKSVVLLLVLYLLPSGAGVILRALGGPVGPPDEWAFAGRLGTFLMSQSISALPFLVVLAVLAPRWLGAVRRVLRSLRLGPRRERWAALVGGAVAFWLFLVAATAIHEKLSAEEVAWKLLVASVVVPLVAVGYMLASWIVDALWARRPVLVALLGAMGLLLALEVGYARSIRPKSLSASEIVETRLRPEGDEWVAEVIDVKGRRQVLQTGDRLRFAVVRSISASGLFVEEWWERGLKGRQYEKRLLRFIPPGEPPPITLGPDTTWITSPLLPDGTPDYGAWLNERYGAGVTEDNNAAPMLDAAVESLVDTGQTFWDDVSVRGEKLSSGVGQVMYGPWTDVDCPDCVQRLIRNEEPLAQITEAVRRPHYFHPGATGSEFCLSEVASPLLPKRDAANALAGRGMLRLGRGDLNGAVADALTLQRLALLLGQGPTLIEPLIGVAIRGIGAALLPAIAAAPSLEVGSAQELLDQLMALSPMPQASEVIDLGQRSFELARLLFLRGRSAHRGPGGLFEVLEPSELRWYYDPHPSSQPQRLLYLLPADSVDWDEALRQANQRVDLWLAVLRADTVEERQRAQAAVDTEERELAIQRQTLTTELERVAKSQTGGLAAAIDRLGGTAEGRRRLAVLAATDEQVLRVGVSWNETEAQFRLGVLAVALARHRLEHGGYPADLERVALPRLPAWLMQASPLPGYVLHYYADTGGSGEATRHGTFALTAVPEAPGETGVRGFCVDSTGQTRITSDSSEPKLVNGLCDPTSAGLG